MDSTLADFIKTRKIGFPRPGGAVAGTKRGGGRGRGATRGATRGNNAGYSKRGNSNRGRGGSVQRGAGKQQRGTFVQRGFVQKKGFVQRGGQVKRGASQQKRGGYVQKTSLRGQGVTRGNARGGRGRGVSVTRGFGVRGGGVQKKFVQTQRTQNPQTIAAVAGLAKLYISNLDFAVTNQDIKELFMEFGQVKKYTVNFGESGKSLGTAEVHYVNKANAVKAMQKYNNVTLDGRPMKIEISGGMPEPAQSRVGKTNPVHKVGVQKTTFTPSKRGGVVRGGFVQKRGYAKKVLQAARQYVARGKAGQRGVARGKAGQRGRGGRGGKQQKAAPSAEQMDADLDRYANQKD